MVSHICARVRGSRPVVGSSRKMSGGCAMRDAARSRRRRMPPEKFLRGRLAASVRPNCSSSSAALRRESARLRPSRRPKSTRFSVAERVSSTEAYCPVTPMSWRTICGSRGHVVAEDAGGAAVGAQQRREHADGGGLAGAVRSEDAVDGAGLHAEVDAVDRPVVAEHLHESLGLDGPVSGGSCHVTSIRAPAFTALSSRCRAAVIRCRGRVGARPREGFGADIVRWGATPAPADESRPKPPSVPGHERGLGRMSSVGAQTPRPNGRIAPRTR